MPGDQRSVEGVVLAGTYRWGESPFERVLRGPLLPVAQTPLICYPLRWLRDGGVRQATICVNDAVGAVRAAIGSGDAMSMRLDYHEEGGVPRGAAGCVRDAGARSAAHTLVVVEGALIPSAVDLRELLAAHRYARAAATVVVDADRRRSAIGRERPRTPGGIYVFDRGVLDAIPSTGFQDIKEGLLERLYHAGERVITHEVPGISPRVLNYESYAAVSHWQIAVAVQRPAALEGYIRVGEGLRHHSARVDPRARLVGPVLVGPGARLMEGAVVVGPATIGAETRLEREALVTRSLLWSRCVVGAHAQVDGCLLTDGTAVAPHEQLAGVVRIPGADGTATVSAPLREQRARAVPEGFTAVPAAS